jgi:putative endonuclease
LVENSRESVAPRHGSKDAIDHIAMHGIGARFVYILRSESDSERHYVGRTSNVDQRLDWHNGGPSGYTVHNRPWSIVVSLEFPDERAAARFERYLKSGSGRAFAKRHFAPGE